MKKFEKKGMDEKGLKHVIAAFSYSMAGLKVLLGESAARLEIAFFAITIILGADPDNLKKGCHGKYGKRGLSKFK